MYFYINVDYGYSFIHIDEHESKYSLLKMKRKRNIKLMEEGS